MKDFAFPPTARSFAAKLPAAPGAPASPSTLSPRLLGDLAMLFDRESRYSTSYERARLYRIGRELDRLWRMKATSVRGTREGQR
jgi:hypothetical protein